MSTANAKRRTGLAITFALIACIFIQSLYQLAFAVPAQMMYRSVGWPLPTIMIVSLNGMGAYAAIAITSSWFRNADIQAVFYAFSSLMVALGLFSIVFRVTNGGVLDGIIQLCTVIAMLIGAKLGLMRHLDMR